MGADERPQQRSAVAWVKEQRRESHAFEAAPFEGKLSLDAVADYSRRQVELCHRQAQNDLDLLHDQIHEEMHKSVTNELRGVLADVSNARHEAMDALRKALEVDVRPLMEELSRVLAEDIGPLRTKVEELHKAGAQGLGVAQEKKDSEGDATELEALRVELQDLREETRQLREQSPNAAQEVTAVLLTVEAKSREAASEVARTVAEQTAKEAGQKAAQMEAQVYFQAREAAQEAIVSAETAVASNACREEIAELRSQTQALQERLESRIGALGAELRSETSQLVEQAETARVHGDKVLEQLAQLSEVRFQESQEAIAALERRHGETLRRSVDDIARRSETYAGQVEGLVAQCGDLEREAVATAAKVSSMTKSLNEMGGAALQELRSEVGEVSRGLETVRAGWARTIEWSADIGGLVLGADGEEPGSLTSPAFAAACQTGLRLRLQLAPSPRGWAVGLFLVAPGGQLSFRLHAAGKSQTYEAAVFGEGGAPEWGSPRLCTLSTLPGSTLKVKLEILEVSLALPATPANQEPQSTWWPQGITGSVHVADEAYTAAREAAAIRAGFVRRVEWRLTHVSERIDAARRAHHGSSLDDEALEPWVTPPFAAAGLENLRLQVYPLGYRPKGDEMCGLFLTCPKGVFVRCRLFVGDAFRVFEHSYDSREPFGRQGMCRLGDKAAGDDSVLCGVEFLEVRQESTAQVRGGPFGNYNDQVKLVLSPGGGGMESIRLLAELDPPAGGSRGDAGRVGQRPGQGRRGARAAQQAHGGDTSPLPRLAPSKSVPLLRGEPGDGMRGRRAYDV